MRKLGDGSHSSTPTPQTANDRFKERARSWFWGSLSAAAVVHFLFFAFLPALQASDWSSEDDKIKVIQPPDELVLPPEPEVIPRPATPVVGPDEIDPDVTIGKTVIDEYDPEDLPEPPRSDERARNPTFTPMDVPPVLLNPDGVSRALERAYPEVLRDAGIGGTVEVWFFINEDGTVEAAQVNETSGHQRLDDIAVDIADLYEFSPALNRDKRVSVWVSIPIHFRSR